MANSAEDDYRLEHCFSDRLLEDKERTLLDLKVCDPASGSGHFLLAAARRIARELARVRTGEDEPDPASYRNALRDVVRQCIYAVDKNPLAVDLCKVALWIESHAVSLPLGFLDHHIKCGDSLIGVIDTSVLTEGIPNDAYKAVTGDDKDAATYYRRRNTKERQGQRPLNLGGISSLMQSLAKDFAAFGDMEERNPAEVHAKEDLYNQMRGPDSDWWERKTACDMWTYAFFAPLQMQRTNGLDCVPTTDHIRKAMHQPGSVSGRLVGQAVQASMDRGFFHWPLEFPEVFKSGGFDVVLGNPPWDLVQPEEIKFFEVHNPQIASLSGARRKAALSQLPQTNPKVWELWESHKREIEGLSKFLHSSGRFELTGTGKINKYAVFAETARQAGKKEGRVGMIIPLGIATDNTTRHFFSDIIRNRSLVSLYDFENREGIFQGVHRSYKFSLLTLSGQHRPCPEAEFAFFLYRTEELLDENRRFTLGPDDFALFNPNTRNCPIYRTRREAEIARKIYRRAGVFWKESSHSQPEMNPWRVSFSQMINMTSGSPSFRTRSQLEGSGWEIEGNNFIKGDDRYLPLYEAKLLYQYDHRFGCFGNVNEVALEKGDPRNPNPEEKANISMVAIPRFWIPEVEVIEKFAPRTDEESSLTNKLSTLKDLVQDSLAKL